MGTLLRAANRHPWRPAHIHFKIEAAGFDTLVTALYLRGDPYENSDAVFGVKSSLVVDIEEEEEEEEEHVGGAKRRRLRYDFGMVTEEDTTELRVRKAVEALAKLGSRAKIVEGLPVAEVD